MKKLFEILRWVAVLVLASPFIVAWLPMLQGSPLFGLSPAYWETILSSFRQLSITLVSTVAVATGLTMILGYISVLVPWFGKLTASILDSIESIPSILIALFAYAPVAAVLAKNPSATSALVSLMVFIFAATITTLPEAVRGLTLPLGELYHRKYSVSFRAYGFTKSRILLILMNSKVMRDVLRRTAAAILAKTLVLDTSFGFIIQIGMGSYGTPAHASPGALIAANRDAVFSTASGGRVPEMFWIPVVLLVLTSMSFLLVLGNNKEAKS